MASPWKASALPTSPGAWHRPDLRDPAEGWGLGCDVAKLDAAAEEPDRRGDEVNSS